LNFLSLLAKPKNMKRDYFVLVAAIISLGVSCLAAPAAVMEPRDFIDSPEFQATALTSALATGDFNGDGALDLVTGSAAAGRGVGILLGKGDGSFRNVQFVLTGKIPRSIAVADFNGDDKLDIVASAERGTISLATGNGDGTFQVQTGIPAGLGVTALAAGDFDMDGKMDVAVANGTTNGQVAILLGRGDGSFKKFVSIRPGAIRLRLRWLM
jgi:hypothetical protein